MEKIKQTVLQVEQLYSEICELLKQSDRQHSTAANGMLRDALSVRDYAATILRTDQLTNQAIGNLLSAQKSFGRHLSEVEQSVYEAIGSDDYEKLQTILERESEPYNRIYYYLGLGKDK